MTEKRGKERREDESKSEGKVLEVGGKARADKRREETRGE